MLAYLYLHEPAEFRKLCQGVGGFTILDAYRAYKTAYHEASSAHGPFAFRYLNEYPEPKPLLQIAAKAPQKVYELLLKVLIASNDYQILDSEVWLLALKRCADCVRLYEPALGKSHRLLVDVFGSSGFQSVYGQMMIQRSTEFDDGQEEKLAQKLTIFATKQRLSQLLDSADVDTPTMTDAEIHRVAKSLGSRGRSRM